MLKTLIFIFSSVNTGDISHVEALRQTVKQMQPTAEFLDVEANLNPTQLSEKFERTVKNFSPAETICLAVGEKGLDALSKLDLSKKKFMVGLSLHQYFPKIGNLINQNALDFIAIPKNVIDTEEKRQIIAHIDSWLTLGIPTKNLSVGELKKSYKEWYVPNKPAVGHNYIIIMLPGDAPRDDGKYNLFTKESANDLFVKIHTLWNKTGQNHKIIIQNSPRTGKFDEDGNILCAHEYTKGENPEKAVDDISLYFKTLLDASNIPYEFYNFAFELDKGSKKPISVYNPLLYLAQLKKESYFILPGESISMISQLPVYLKPDQIIVFEPSSMNDQHKKVLDHALEEGYICQFGRDDIVTSPLKAEAPFKPDAQEVAEALLQSYNKSFRS